MSKILLLKNKTEPKDPYHDILSSSSFQPIFIPLLNHQQINQPETLSLFTSQRFLNQTKAFIITSQRAVESLSDTLKLVPNELRPALFEKPAYTVGPATFKILKELGFRDVRGGSKAGNGDLLSDIILSDLEADDDVVFFTGEIRRDIIPKKLANGNIKLQEIVIYKTEERSDIIDDFRLNYLNESSGSVRWIIFFSPQGTKDIVEHLRQLTPLRDVKIASIGPTTEKYLIENGIPVDLVSEKPDAENLYKGLLSFEGQ